MPSRKGLTDITARNEFAIDRPNNSAVVFAFDETRPYISRLTLPRGSTWEPGLHWHESYTEYLQVVQGRVTVVIDGTSKVVTSADGPQVIPKFAIHSWMRADRDSADKDAEDAIVDEWTDPRDGIKQVFFRNLLGVIDDAPRYWGWQTPLQVLLIASTYDNYNVFGSSFKTPQWMTYYITHTVFTASWLAARLCSLSPWYDEYTPTELRAIAAESVGGKTKPKTS